MALFTDGPASEIEDLAAQDSQALNVASAEGIDLTRKLALAHEAIGIELEGMLREGSNLALANVVATPALRLWHTYRTLETVYRDAYHNQLNDRYAGKRDQFRELGMRARERLRETGVGMALRPTPRAGRPEVQPTAGLLGSGTFYCTIAWVNEVGEEGAAARSVAAEAPDGGFVVAAPAAPDGISGWNVYAGESPDAMSRQNAAPLALGASWTATQLTAGGSAPGDGQAPNYVHPLPRILQRG